MDMPNEYPESKPATIQLTPPAEPEDGGEVFPPRIENRYMMGDLVVIERPDAQLPLLRFKIGRMEKRGAVFPSYDGNRQIGERVTDYQIDIFHLFGFGETLEKAEAMARRAH